VAFIQKNDRWFLSGFCFRWVCNCQSQLNYSMVLHLLLQLEVKVQIRLSLLTKLVPTGVLFWKQINFSGMLFYEDWVFATRYHKELKITEKKWKLAFLLKLCAERQRCRQLLKLFCKIFFITEKDILLNAKP